jgi:hypothetical protein
MKINRGTLNTKVIKSQSENAKSYTISTTLIELYYNGGYTPLHICLNP